MHKYQIKNKLTRIVFLVAFVFLFNTIFSFSKVFAQDKTLDISVHIFNKSNQPIADGEYNVRFAIYTKNRTQKDPYPSDSDEESMIWEEEQTVEVIGGVFSTLLGEKNALPGNLNFTDRTYYLGIRVGKDSESIPRKKIGYVPLAINSDFLEGKKTGTEEGNILVLGKNGLVDVNNLPIGTDEKSLVTLNSKGEIDHSLIPTGEGDNDFVQGDDERLHDQNTDTGTKSTDFNIGSNDGSFNIFNIFASNNSQKPTIRYNGSVGVWQYSNDGTTFSEFGFASSGNFLPTTGGTMTGNITFNSTQTFGSTTATELGYLSGLTFSAGSILYGSDSDSLTALTGVLGDDTQYLRFNWNGGSPTLSWESGVFNSFTLAGDSGTSQSITDGNTLTIAGGTNISTVASATDTITINLDSTLTGVTWNGNAIDISSYTNLSGDAEIVLTGDTLSIASTIARDSELHSAVTMSGAYDYITLSGQDIVRGQVNLTTDVSGILPVANGGSGTSSALTQGSVVFAGASGVYSQDNANLFWDDSNNRLGIGDATPTENLTVAGSASVSTQFTATDYLGIKIDDPMVEDSLKIGNPTHIDSLRDILNHDLSSGTTHDGDITNNGDGTVSISAGTALMRATADSHADMYSMEFPAQNNIALTDNSINYVYLDFNAGSPVFNVTTSVTGFNCQDKCLAYTIVREGTVLHIVDAREQNVDANRKHRRMLLETESFRHVDGGTVLGATGTRNISVTAGAFYYGLNRIDHGAFDTSAGSTFNYYYRDGLGGWTKVTGQTQINNLQWDNGTGTLATLSGGRYGVHWVYILNDDPSTLVVQYGQGDYTSLASARVATVPTASPAMQGVGVLIGRIIIQKSDAAFSSVDSALLQTFSPSTATTHNGLSGLQGGASNDYYHLTAVEYTNLHSAVTVSGAYDYITLSGQDIVRGQIDLTTDVTGILPVANGGSGTSTAFTQGSLVFAGASGVYSQDNASLFWDDTNNRLGIGDATPASKLTITNTGAEASLIINDEVGDTSPIIIDALGNVMIGTTTSSGKFSLAGSFFEAFPETDEAFSIGPSADAVFLQASNVANSVTKPMTIQPWGSTLGIGASATSPTHLIELDADTYGTTAGWVDASDRNKKENFTNLENIAMNPVKIGTWTGNGSTMDAIEYDNGEKVTLNSDEVLNRIAMLPITQWNFINDGDYNEMGDGEIKHIGPTAQDFYKMFGLGSSDTRIKSTDMAGIALYGVKGVLEKLSDNDAEVEEIVSEVNQNTEVISEVKITTDTQFASIYGEMGSIKLLNSDQDNRILALEIDSSNQENEIEELRQQNQTLVDFMLAIESDSFVKKDEFGNMLLDGDIEAEMIKGEEFVIKFKEQTNQTVGSARICPVAIVDINSDGMDDCSGDVISLDENGILTGNTELNNGKSVFISTSVVDEKSKIFTNLKTVSGNPLIVSEVNPGVGFKVEIAEVSNIPLEFDWWVVGTEGE